MAGKKKHKKAFIIGLGISAAIAVLIGGTIVYFRGNRLQESTADNQQTYTVQLLSYSETIETSGNIEALQSEAYSFSVTGELSSVAVKEGDLVAKGTLLASLDDLSLQYNLAQIDYEINQNSSDGSPRQLELLEMQRSLAAKELAESSLYASFDGLVSEVYYEEGDQISAGSEVVKIVDLSMLKASVEIDEIDIPLLEAGQRVEFIFDAYPDIRYNGYVSHIPLEASVTSNGIAVMEVELLLTDPDAALIPAFTFTAEIYLQDAEDVLVIDKNAVLTQGIGMGMVVLLNESDGSSQPVRIEYDEYDSDHYLVISGVNEGDILASAQSLMDEDGGLATGALRIPGLGGNGGERPEGGPPAGTEPPNGAVPPSGAAGPGANG